MVFEETGSYLVMATCLDVESADLEFLVALVEESVHGYVDGEVEGDGEDELVERHVERCHVGALEVGGEFAGDVLGLEGDEEGVDDLGFEG